MEVRDEETQNSNLEGSLKVQIFNPDFEPEWPTRMDRDDAQAQRPPPETPGRLQSAVREEPILPEPSVCTAERGFAAAALVHTNAGERGSHCCFSFQKLPSVLH